MDVYTWLKAQWDRVAAAGLMVAGLISLLLGYEGISHSTLPTQQIPYLASGGLLGIFCLAGASTLWLSADLRDEWRKLDEIHRDLRSSANGDSNSPAIAHLQEATRPSTVDLAADIPTGKVPVAASGSTAALLDSSEKPKRRRAPRAPHTQGLAE